MFIKHVRANILNETLWLKAVFVLITIFWLVAAGGCGKRVPPLPPVERVLQRVEISGFQQGNLVNIFWTLPARNASDQSVLKIDRIDVYRLAEPIDSGVSLTEEEFASRSTLIGSLVTSDADFAKKRLTYNDKLDFAGQAVRLRYAIRFVNASGQKAGFSNFLLIEPTAKIAAAPSVLSGTETESAVTLHWNSPVVNVDGSQPANVLGYNIYRKTAEEVAFKPLNNSPVTYTKFADSFFEFGKQYTYFVRAVSLGSNAEPVESSDSNTVTITPNDIFPPTAPAAITVAAAPNNISIFFAVNPEKDVVGYRLYRTTNPNLPKTDWNVLTRQLLITNTFQDTSIESGKNYYYYLTAVDTAGNVSKPSEVVSETAP